MPSTISNRNTGARSKKKRKANWNTTRTNETLNPNITVQFSTACDENEQLENLQRLIGRKFIKSMEQVFPGENDLDLGTLVVVTLRKSVPIENAIEILNADDEIKIAHPAEERKPQKSMMRLKNEQ